MRIFLLILGISLAFGLSLLLLRIRLILEYRETVVLRLRILCFSIPLFPKKKKRVKLHHYTKKALARKERKTARKSARKAARKEKKASSPRKDRKKASLGENLRLVRGLLAVLIRRTGKHLHLHAYRLHVRVASEDAAKTAILYGVVSQFAAYFSALLRHVVNLHIHPGEDVAVTADFLSEKPSVDIKLIFSLRVAGALAILFSMALSYLRERRTRNEERKKATTQPSAHH